MLTYITAQVKVFSIRHDKMVTYFKSTFKWKLLYNIPRLLVLVLRRRLIRSQLQEWYSLNCSYRIDAFDFSNSSQYCLWRKVVLKRKIVHVSPFQLNRPLFGAENNSKKVTNSREGVTFVEYCCACRSSPTLPYFSFTVALWNRHCFPHFFLMRIETQRG